MNNFDPNRKHIFYYTMNCAMCGKVVLDDADELRKRIKEAGYYFEIREVPLYHGWKSEVKKIGEEPPFFYNYDTQTVAKLSDIIWEGKDVHFHLELQPNGDICTSKSEIPRRVLLEENLKQFLSEDI